MTSPTTTTALRWLLSDSIFDLSRFFNYAKLKKSIKKKLARPPSRRLLRGKIQSLQDRRCRILDSDPANTCHVLATAASETGRAWRSEFQDASSIVCGRKQIWLVDAGHDDRRGNLERRRDVTRRRVQAHHIGRPGDQIDELIPGQSVAKIDNFRRRQSRGDAGGPLLLPLSRAGQHDQTAPRRQFPAQLNPAIFGPFADRTSGTGLKDDVGPLRTLQCRRLRWIVGLKRTVERAIGKKQAQEIAGIVEIRSSRALPLRFERQQRTKSAARETGTHGNAGCIEQRNAVLDERIAVDRGIITIPSNLRGNHLPTLSVLRELFLERSARPVEHEMIGKIARVKKRRDAAHHRSGPRANDQPDSHLRPVLPNPMQRRQRHDQVAEMSALRENNRTYFLSLVRRRRRSLPAKGRASQIDRTKTCGDVSLPDEIFPDHRQTRCRIDQVRGTINGHSSS